MSLQARKFYQPPRTMWFRSFFALCSILCLEFQFAVAWSATRQRLSTSRTRIRRPSALHAITKEQTVVYDDAEFFSILSFILLEDQSSETQKRLLMDTDALDEIAPPNKKAGKLTFLCGSTLTSDERIVGIQIPDDFDKNDGIELEEGVFVYSDSVAAIPDGISDADAISTASAALCGVHCGMPFKDASKTKLGTTVVLGGGDYACFTASALSKLGAKVHLVTTRPMQLKDTPLNPLRETSVIAMPPVSEEDDDDDEEDKGFAQTIGEFQTCIDTLGDEAKLAFSSNLKQALDRFVGESGVASKLKRANQCQHYVSALTKSQRFVLEEGLLFARDYVTKYQNQVEKAKKVNPDDYFQLVSPRNYGNTIQKLFDLNEIFPTDRNENGSHKNKKQFVRGCSFPDYAEREIWPSSTEQGAVVRFGFPSVEELTMEEKIEEIMGNSKQPKTPNVPKKVATSTNPYVASLNSLSEIKEAVVQEEKDCILFISAPYCKVCRTIDSQYTRLARIFKEENESDVIFAKASTSGKSGKQLTFTFEVDSVPSFILFRKGKRYGEKFGVTKIPSKKLDMALEYLESGIEWDAEVFQSNETETGSLTKLQ